MRISDWSSDVCSSDLHRGSPCAGFHLPAIPLSAGPGSFYERGQPVHDVCPPALPAPKQMTAPPSHRGSRQTSRRMGLPKGCDRLWRTAFSRADRLRLPLVTRPAHPRKSWSRLPRRSDERVVGKEGVRKGRSRVAPSTKKKTEQARKKN